MSDFQALYSGRLWSVLSWEQLTALWGRIDSAAGWYVYAVGETVPTAPAASQQVAAFVAAIDALLRKEHCYDYCGVVYADNLEAPTIVKIFDPNNLGVACGFSAAPPLPGWIMSLVPPVDLNPAYPAPEGRRRWWRELLTAGGPHSV